MLTEIELLYHMLTKIELLYHMVTEIELLYHMLTESLTSLRHLVQTYGVVSRHTQQVEVLVTHDGSRGL